MVRQAKESRLKNIGYQSAEYDGLVTLVLEFGNPQNG